MDCIVLFEECEWKSVCIVADKKLPSCASTLNQFIRTVASLGGYVKRKNTELGYQTLWIGMQRMHDFAIAFQVFGPGSEVQSQETPLERRGPLLSLPYQPFFHHSFSISHSITSFSVVFISVD